MDVDFRGQKQQSYERGQKYDATRLWPNTDEEVPGMNTQQDPDVERYLAVGRQMVFQADPHNKFSPRFLTVLRGWRRPDYLLVDRPMIKGRQALLREGQECVLRYVAGGRACAIDSMVMDWDTRPHNSYCRIQWPRQLSVVQFRRSERFAANLPCTVAAGELEYEAEIADISANGCCLNSPAAAELKEQLRLTFRLPDGTPVDEVVSEVKTNRLVKGRYVLGCEFLEGQATVENDIAFYIVNCLGRGQMATLSNSSKPRVLIISENPGNTTPLKLLLENEGAEVVISAYTVEGLYRMRVINPLAVVVDQGQSDLAGIQTAHMLRATRGMENLAIFLINAGPTIMQTAEETGINAGFAPETPAMAIVRTILPSLGAIAAQA